MNISVSTSTSQHLAADQRTNHVSDFAVVGGSNVLATLVNVLLGMFLVRQFSPAIYGQVTFLLASFGLVRLLATCGMGNRLTLDVARSLGLRDPEGLNRAFYSLLLLRGLVALTLIFAALSAALSNQTYVYIALLVVPASLSDYSLAALQGGGRARLMAAAILSQPLSYAGLALALLHMTHTVHAVYIALIGSYVVSMTIGMGLVARLGLQRPRSRFFDIRVAKAALGFISGSFAIVVVQYVSSILSTYLLGSVQLFAQAAQLGVVLNLVLMPAGLLFIPTAAVFQARFIRVYEGNGTTASAAFVTEFVLFVYRLSVGMAAVAAAFAQPIVLLLFGPAYRATSSALIVLSPLMCLSVLQNVFIFVLMGLGKPHRVLGAVIAQTLLTGFLVALTISLARESLIVLATVQIVGAGVGTILLRRAVQRELPINWHGRQYLSTLMIAVLSVGLARGLGFWLPHTLPLDIAQIVIATVVYSLWLCKPLTGRSPIGWIAALKTYRRSTNRTLNASPMEPT